MANARQLIASRAAISSAPAEREMTANELLEIMCANSADNKASLYDGNVKSVSGAQFWMATSTSAGDNNWLEEIVLPNCTSVKYRTFYRCAGLKRLILPSLTSCTAASSFQYLSSIEELDIGNVVSSSSISLTGANVNGFTIYIGNGYYYSGIDENKGVLNIPDTVTGPVKIVFNGSNVGKNVLRGMTHQVDVEILSSVTSLGASCFYYCTGLTSITIPESVTSLGGGYLIGCTGLTSAGPIGGDYSYKFGWTESIPANAFGACESLTSVTLPQSVTSLGTNCFYNCTGLTSITLPESVTSLGVGCFYNCTGLTSITSRAIVPPTAGNICFNYIDTSIPVYVPAGSVSAYKSAAEWRAFTNIQAIPETV